MDSAKAAVHSVGIRRGEADEVIEAKGTSGAQQVDLGTATWISLEDNFFFAAFVPESGVSTATLRPVWVRPAVDPAQPRFLAAETAEKDLVKEVLVIAEANQEEVKGRLYFGAKQYSYLQGLPYHLEHTIRWGWLFFLAKPLYLTLLWVHANVVSNFGWAIVIVTFLIKLVFFPLTWKSSKAMTKMQELSPKMTAIRTKYRPKLKDKQGKPNFEAQRQMNDEVMALYRQAGVNPASGCLPMLLQMPVFFAFYRLLTLAVELRQAPWMLWIHDLSMHDPYHVLPLLMGATSVILQRMSPPPPDPMQAKLLQILPVVFTIFAFAFPSGLVIYWVTSNLLTMAQQALILKRQETPPSCRDAAQARTKQHSEVLEIKPSHGDGSSPGVSVDQAVMTATRRFGIEPEGFHKVRDKKTNFLNARRRVLIEVDPAIRRRALGVLSRAGLLGLGGDVICNSRAVCMAVSKLWMPSFSFRQLRGSFAFENQQLVSR